MWARRTLSFSRLASYWIINFVTIGTKGFFDELGRILAKKTIGILSEKDKPVKLKIVAKNYKIELVIPPNTSDDHLSFIERFIEKIDSSKSGKYIYSPESKTFIVIEKFSNYDDELG